jgi:hypothetical protein
MIWSHPFYAIRDGDLPHIYISNMGLHLDLRPNDPLDSVTAHRHHRFRTWRPSTPDRPLFRFNTEIDILRRMALGVGLSAHAEQQWRPSPWTKTTPDLRPNS